MLTPDLINKVNTWRQKCLDGSISTEDMKEAILMLRASRRSAMDSAKKPAKSPGKSTSDLLAELNGL